MAIKYQATIDLVVAGLQQLDVAEKRIKALLRESKKLKRGGLAQRGTALTAAVTREGRQQVQRQVKAAERRLTLQSQLNSATDLYNRKLQEFQRAGGAGNKQLQGRVDQITQAFAVGTKEGTKNLKLTRALATELGRVVEKQRELNRARTQGNKGFEATRRGRERIEALQASGLVDRRRLGGAASLVGKISEAAASGDQAKFNEAVRKADVALRRLERELKQAERAQRASTKAKRDVERAEKKLADETKRAAAAQKKRRKQRFQDIATGAGFPLLFGGGPVQALAGGIGGALGGFGGSIAATALAGQVEAFSRAAAETGVALTSTGGALDFMREKSLFSTAAAKERAAQLEELGQVEELAAHLGQEMAKAIGNNGVKALQDLGDTTKETTRLWNLLTTQLFRLVSGPLDAFLKAINRVLGQVTTGSSFKALLEDLAPDQRARAEARFEELRGRVGTGRSAAQSQTLTDTEAQKIVLKEFGGLQKAAATPLPITDEDRRRFAPKAGKDKLPDLQIEIGLQERLLALDKQIAQATLDENDKIKSILEKEKIRETLEANINKIKNDGLRPALEAAKIELERIDAAQKIQDIDIATAQAESDKAKKAKETLDGLLAEQNLLQATLDGKEDEVRLEQRIKDILEQNTNLTEDEVRGILEGSAALKEKIRLQKESEALFRKIATTIENGLVDGIMSAIDGTKSLSESLSGVLKQLGRIFLTAGIGSFNVGGKGGSGLLGLIPGLANGGSATAGRPYVVGERGPELFVPNRSGTVVPNGAMGGASVTVNVDASGSSVEGNGDEAARLGKMLGAAVQAELVKQKRPGGLLA